MFLALWIKLCERFLQDYRYRLLLLLSYHITTPRIAELLEFCCLSCCHLQPAQDFSVGLSDLAGKRAAAQGNISKVGFRVEV